MVSGTKACCRQVVKLTSRLVFPEIHPVLLVEAVDALRSLVLIPQHWTLLMSYGRIQMDSGRDMMRLVLTDMEADCMQPH